MATKSFVTEFKFTTKSGYKLLDAIENSKTHEHVFAQPVSTIRDKDIVNSIMDSFLRKNS